MVNLFVYEADVNRFTISYLMSVLQQEGMEGDFNISFFRDVRALDAIFAGEDVKKRPTVFMFSFMTPLLPPVMELLGRIREGVANARLSESALLIAGGPHVTGDPESGLRMGFDLVFSGEGEASWVEFLGRAKGAGTFKKFREQVVSGYEKSVVETSELVSLDKYNPFGTIYKLVPPIEVMRGCYFNCRFCQTAVFKVRFRELSSIEEYFREYKRRGYKRLSFICPSAFHYKAPSPRSVNLEAVEQMLSLNLKYKVPMVEFGLFPSESRPDTVTEDAIRLVRKYCSNKKMSVGAQSGDEDCIKTIGRGHSLDSVYNACRIMRSFDITPIVDIIFGFPGETADSQMKTLDMMRDLHTKHGARIQTHFFLPLPGTPYYKKRYTPINPRALKLLRKYNIGGICTNWYEDGMRQSEIICGLLDKI